MPAEFLHFRAYARKSTKGSPTADAVLGEARRDPKYCAHLDEPQPPIVRYGVPIESVAATLSERLRDARDRRGRPLPSTTTVLLAGVSSWPTPRVEVEASEDERLTYEMWGSLCVAFFRRLFGDALLSVIEHVDEDRLHLHIFAAATPDPVTHVYSIESIWPPMAAEATQRRAGKSRRVQRAAFRAEATKIQDAYYNRVGAVCGLSRFGPRRQRLTREAWRAQRDQAAAVAEFTQKVARKARAIDDEITSRATTLAREIAAMAVANATTAANADIARAEALRDRLTAQYRSIEQQLRDEERESARLRDQLVDLGVDPDKLRP